ncbi:MAG: hypothetical protein QGD93_03085 [Actinomycetota bacterium]|nr:hypothetical protein [Actinomycetota bacterium]
MSVLLVTHPSSLKHITPVGHPERVERVLAVVEGARPPAGPPRGEG